MMGSSSRTLTPLIVAALLCAGCGSSDPYDRDPALSRDLEIAEAQAQAAYACMPPDVQRRYDRLLNGPEGSPGRSARLDGLIDQYLPRVGEEC